ncbi:MAG: hypothetical protein ACYDBJ_01315 [Aggregatilineales bacterium]
MNKAVAEAAWIKTRIGDELGLTEDDLARLYGALPGDLDSHLVGLAPDSEAAVQRILADVNAASAAHRVVILSDEQITAARQLVADYPFHPLSPLAAALGHAWRLGSDDAQWIAFRIADLIGLDFASSDILRLRLNRLGLSYEPDVPGFNAAFRNRVADTALYLSELVGVL